MARKKIIVPTTHVRALRAFVHGKTFRTGEEWFETPEMADRFVQAGLVQVLAEATLEGTFSGTSEAGPGPVDESDSGRSEEDTAEAGSASPEPGQGAGAG